MSATTISSMTVELDSWRARWMIEALRTLDQQWQDTLDAPAGEDVHADVGIVLTDAPPLAGPLHQATASI